LSPSQLPGALVGASIGLRPQHLHKQQRGQREQRRPAVGRAQDTDAMPTELALTGEQIELLRQRGIVR